MDELIECRRENNVNIVDSLRKSDWDHELYDIAMDDAAFGCSTEPVVLREWHLDNVTLCRRIPIREK